MNERDKYTQLLKEVLGNAKGEELLDVWQEVFIDRASFVEGIPTEEVLVREGERRAFIAIKHIVNS